LKQLGAHFDAQLRIEVAQRFVEQKHGGFANDGATDRVKRLPRAPKNF
jgi:hypothetical protein